MLTNASKNRADMLVEFYNLQNYFFYIYYNISGNKYYNLIDNLNLNPNNIIVFDNEVDEIKNAKYVASKDAIKSLYRGEI